MCAKRVTFGALMHENRLTAVPAILPALISDYLDGKQALREFHEGIPSEQLLLSRLSNRHFSGDSRSTLTAVLRCQYQGVDPKSPVIDQISALAAANSVTVTTGHQLCLATGPLYVIYKALSVIALARRLNQIQSEVHVVPVFWMATEDHDVAEIDHVRIQGQDIRWETAGTGATGRLSTDGLKEMYQLVLSQLGPSEIAEELADLFDSIVNAPDYATSFRKLLHELFGDFGLVVVDGDDRQLKKQFAPILREEIRNQIVASSVTETTDKLLKLGYSSQANPRPVNLFFLLENQRIRIDRKGDNEFVLVDGQRTFTSKEIETILNETPETFSPNVLLRPVYQEFLLPNIATIGGPGELAYWLQLRGLFQNLNVPFPLLVLRDSFLLVHPRAAQRLDKLGFEPTDLLLPRHELERRLAAAAGPIELEDEKQELAELFARIAQKAREIDPTLEPAAGAEAQKQLASLDHFSKRMLKAARQKEDQRISQLHKLLDEVFPDGTPQERVENYFDHCARIGRWLIPELLDCCNPLDHSLNVLRLTPSDRADQATTEE